MENNNELKNFAILLPKKATPLPESYIIPEYKITDLGENRKSFELVGYKLRHVTVILPKKNKTNGKQ